MTAIALAVFTLFIAYVMIWSVKNDHARSIGEQTGLIKMRKPRLGKRPGKAMSVPKAMSAPLEAAARSDQDRRP